jgi:CRP-like cAMP-binding protein
MPGELLDSELLAFHQSDFDVQATSRVVIGEIDLGAFRKLVHQRPAIRHALWSSALADNVASDRWLMNVRYLGSRLRIAALLCDFISKCDDLGLGNGDTYPLPLTQRQMGDAAGLSSVHVNRTLKALAAEEIIRQRRGTLVILDRAGLHAVAQGRTAEIKTESAAM